MAFEIISDKNEGFVLGKDVRERLKEEHGEHFADSYASKLGNTHLLLARKKANPAKANPGHFWFETLGKDKENVKITPGQKDKEREKTRNERNEQFVPEREVKTDSRGNVLSIKKLRGENDE